MSVSTKIQWCDTTVNPFMGCGGCELFEAPGPILAAIDQKAAMLADWPQGTARKMATELIDETWNKNFVEGDFSPGPGHTHKITTSNIYHLRKEWQKRVAESHGRQAAAAVRDAIEEGVTCYAAKLHLNKGHSIVNPTRRPNKGYAPTFEQVTPFPARVEKASRLRDLLGNNRVDKPWLDGLPRLIFVSDMGDAFSRKSDFPFLRGEVEHMRSGPGGRHLWLWLTKRPETMAHFADSIGGLPANICAMTTVTSANALHRVGKLRQVDASVRGLSIEPLWTEIPRENLNLEGIDWVIVGGESGKYEVVNPFRLEWAEELFECCREQGVAFFLKQMGRRPTRQAADIELADNHGGDWDEWPPHLRVREMPDYFWEYRSAERKTRTRKTVMRQRI